LAADYRPRLITRRRAILAGLATVGGVFIARRPSELPPTYGNLLRMGDTFTYAAHRALLPGQSLVKEYTLADLSSFPATGTTNPGDQKDKARADAYRTLQAGGFADDEQPTAAHRNKAARAIERRATICLDYRRARAHRKKSAARPRQFHWRVTRKVNECVPTYSRTPYSSCPRDMPKRAIRSRRYSKM